MAQEWCVRRMAAAMLAAGPRMILWFNACGRSLARRFAWSSTTARKISQAQLHVCQGTGIDMGGFNSRQFQDMLQQAQKQAQEIQQKMQQTVVEASAGGGTVTIKMNVQKQVLQVSIDPAAVTSGDVEMLQDLVMAAVNEAGRKVDAAMQSTVGGMLGGLGIPGM